MFYGYFGWLYYCLRYPIHDRMNAIIQFADFLYKKLSWLWTPLFIWHIVATAFEWKKFDVWDAIYCLMYVFYIRDSEK